MVNDANAKRFKRQKKESQLPGSQELQHVSASSPSEPWSLVVAIRQSIRFGGSRSGVFSSPRDSSCPREVLNL